MKIAWEQTVKQAKALDYLLDKVTVEIIFGGGAGGAKSFLGCAWLIIMCGMYPGTRWLMGRKKLKRLKETTLNTFFEICSMWGIKRDVHYKYIDDVGIFWTNGSSILIKDLSHQPSDPNYDDLGSLELTGAFIDEVNQITFKCWQVIQSRIRYKIDKYGLTPKILGTCNPTKNWVYIEFYKKAKDNVIELGKQFIQSLAKDNPFLPKSYIKILENIKDKATRERLLNGNWEYDDDPSCLFSFDSTNDLFTNKVEGKTRVITGDVARKGRDRMIVMYWEGFQIKETHILKYEIKKDTKKSASWIMNFAGRKKVRRSNIILDEDGVGGGVVDNIDGCVGFINNSPAIQPDEAKYDDTKKLNYGNIKAQCYDTLANMSEAGEIGIDEDGLIDHNGELTATHIKEMIIEELGQIKLKDMDKDGKTYVISKDKIKEELGRSPDFADTIMMRMRALFKMPNKEPRILTIS